MPIPKILHRIWFGPPMPEEFQAYGEAWKRLHPDWDVILWTYANLPPLINHAVFRQAPAADRYRWQSDVLRLELLLRYGGVYVDADTEPLRPIDPLLEGAEAFLGWSPNRAGKKRLVTNATMASAPRHEFIKALVDELPAHANRMRGHPTGKVTGPWYVDAIRERQDWPGLVVYDEHVFYPQSIKARREGNEIDLKESYTWHRWDSARRQDKRRKEKKAASPTQVVTVRRPKNVAGAKMSRLYPLATQRGTPYQPTWRNGQTIGASKRDAVGRYDAIAPIVPNGSRVLDLGSHVGYFSHRLADELNCTCLAVAPQAKSTRRVVAYRKKLGPDEIRSVAKTYFDGFDVALALSVLHHTRPWKDHLEALRDVASIVIVETPHPEEKLGSAPPELLREIHDEVLSLGELIHQSGGFNDPTLLRPMVVIRG